jgi:hypothetical protein
MNISYIILSHIKKKKLKNNPYECRLYMVIPHQKVKKQSKSICIIYIHMDISYI